MEPKIDKFIQLQNQIRHSSSDLQDFLKDLDNWEDDIKKKDEKLKTTRTVEESKLPPVRNAFEKKRRKKKARPKPDEKSTPKDPLKPKRISSYDYRSWDKFDVDAACAEVGEDGEAKSSSSSEMETDEEWEIERMKQQATLEKERGNAYFKQGKYNEAIECYSKGIQCDPNNAILPANRAMALLKQEKFGSAEYDCTEALSLDPTYVKAYSRRGVARVGLRKLQAAKEDFQQVLRLESNNKQAMKELEKIERELNPKPEATSLSAVTAGIVKPIYKPPDKRSKKPLVRIKIEEIGDDVDERGKREISRNIKSDISPSEQKLLAADTARFESFKNELEETKVETNNKKKLCTSIVEVESMTMDCEKLDLGSEKKQKMDGESVQDSDVCTSPRSEGPSSPREPDSIPPVPSTSFQFQADWKILKHHPAMFGKYVQCIKPKNYATIFGHALDSDILISLCQVFQDYYIPSNDDVFEELMALKNVKRFSMSIMFFSKSDKKVLKTLFDYLRKQGKHATDEIDDLADDYML